MSKIISLNPTPNKVARVTILFWMLKIIATTLGEMLGDLVSQTFGFGYLYGTILTSGLFIILLIIQLKSKQFSPIKYWMLIIATTTLGTEISDFLDRTLNLGYAAGACILLTLLLNTFWIWKTIIGKIQIYPVYDSNTEKLYWAAILISNSLGTAAGDYLSDDLGLNYLLAAIITFIFILTTILLHYTTKINSIILFWTAFVFTRPFGAAFGDFLTKPAANGGLNLNIMNASTVAFVIFSAMLLFYKFKSKKA